MTITQTIDIITIVINGIVMSDDEAMSMAMEVHVMHSIGRVKFESSMVINITVSMLDDISS